MSVWKTSEDLQDEVNFQIEVVRELRKVHQIPDDLYELYSAKILFLMKKVLFFEDYAPSDSLAARCVLVEMTPFFEDMVEKLNELENFKR